MESYKHINWDEYICQVIAEKIQQKQKMNLARAVIIKKKFEKSFRSL